MKSNCNTRESSKNSSVISEDTSADGLGELQEAEIRKRFLVLLDKAYQYLMRREHSEHELRKKLARWDELGHIDEVIETLQSRKAQSDFRFAEHLARVRVNAGKGPQILEREFSEHRIDSVIIEEVMSDYEDQWASVAESVRTKKFGAAPADSYEQWAKQSRFLQQRGFGSDCIPGFQR